MADVRASLEGLLGHIPSSAFVLASGIVIFLSVLVLLSLMTRRNGKAPPTLRTIPVIGGVLKFMEGPLKLVKEGYEKHGDVFTVNVFHKKITFLIGPEVSNHFFKVGFLLQ
jgi:sterol 14-demethylase